MQRRRTFIESFSPYLQNTANILSESILNRKELERQQIEKQKSQREQASILSQLMNGGYRNKVQPQINPKERIDAFNAPDGLSTQRQAGLFSRITPQNYGIYKDWQKENAPKEKKPHTYLNFDKPEGIYGLNPETDKYELVQPYNPLYKAPEEEPIWKGEGVVGNKKIYRKIFENADGTQRVEDIDTGFYKETSGNGSNTKTIEKLNLDNYKKTLSIYEAKYGSFLAKVGSYQKLAGKNDLTASGKKEEINKDLDTTEQEFAMIVAPEVQGEIDKFYNNIKQRTGGEIPQGYEYQNREGLKKAFETDIENKYKKKILDPEDLSYIDGYDKLDAKGIEELHEEMNAQNYRALKTWSNLKFKRL